jgi:tetratricopeptide (TPR) repeat protein
VFTRLGPVVPSAVLAIRLPITVATAVLLTVATPGQAWSGQGSDAERVRSARAHYEQAVSHYNLDEFAPALSEFREAYRLKPDPSFLFNIAQCHRKLGENAAALDFYRKYLRSLPDAPNRPEIERMIAELRERGAETDKAPVLPIAPVLAPAHAPAPGPAAALTLAPPTAGAAMSPATVPAGPDPSPAYRRWWFWTALGVVAAGAVVTSVVLASTSDKPYAGTLAPGLVTLRSP